MADETGKPKRGLVWALGLVAVALVAAGVYGFFALSSKPAEAGYARFAKGALAKLDAATAAAQPDLQFVDAAGRQMSLAEFRGQVLLVNVWATWCGPCVHELPTLGALARRFDGRAKVMAISVDSESKRADAEAMLAERTGGALDFYVDPTRALAFATGAPGLPITILYDREGKELARLAGGADWSSPEAVALLEAALADS